MSNYASDLRRLIKRCEEVGWPVERPKGRTAGWLYRIVCPDGVRVQIHGTPTDGMTAFRNIIADLNDHGWAEAEAKRKSDAGERRAAALRADREAADAKARRLQQQADAVAAAAGPYAGPQPVDVGWLMTPTAWPETRTVVMTPEVAGKVLDTMNTQNRKRSDARVAFFEGLIRARQFGCTHQGGAIDSNGVLQDGQSRLEAIVNTGESVIMQWSVGMPPENFSRVDAGTSRSASDTAYLIGVANPQTASVAARILLLIEQHGVDAYVASRRTRFSNDTIADALRRFDPALSTSIEFAREARRDIRRANLTGLSCGVYLINRRLPDGDPRPAKFWASFRDGSVERDDPLWKLRQALQNGQSLAGGRPYGSWSALALIIKAWNYRMSGKPVGHLRWRPNWETFPATVFLPPPLESGETA